jgi:hypothetical protein
MKKALLLFPVAILLGVVFTPAAHGTGCETSIPNNLQACFNSQQLNLVVTVNGSFVTVTGNITGTSQAQITYGCINEFNLAAADCPGCPTLVMGFQESTSGYTNPAPHTKAGTSSTRIISPKR